MKNVDKIPNPSLIFLVNKFNFYLYNFFNKLETTLFEFKSSPSHYADLIWKKNKKINTLFFFNFHQKKTKCNIIKFQIYPFAADNWKFNSFFKKSFFFFFYGESDFLPFFTNFFIFIYKNNHFNLLILLFLFFNSSKFGNFNLIKDNEPSAFYQFERNRPNLRFYFKKSIWTFNATFI